jgi:hypothetical protein
LYCTALHCTALHCTAQTLKHVNVLRFLKKIEALRAVVPLQALPILDALAKFREIQHGCFGWDLCSDYSQRIASFTESVEDLKLFCEGTLGLKFTIPWKLHMVCCHLEPLLDRLGRGLALVCEQAGEAIHYRFKGTKSRYRLNKYHVMAGKAQKKAVVQWSSWALHPITKSTMQRYRDKASARRRR